MKSKFLFNICLDKRGKWIARCASAEVQLDSDSKEEAISKMNNALTLFLKNEGANYLSKWKGNPKIINCPEGRVLLPIDIWECKLSGDTCPTQAQVFLHQEKKFMQKCMANQTKKEEILEIIKKGSYNGFHHIVGRGLCVLCPEKGWIKYHYPWELNYLSDYIDIFDTELRIKFLKSGEDQRAYSWSLCPDCFINVIAKLKPDILDTFKKICLDFYR